MAPGLGPQVLLTAQAPNPAPGVVRPSPSRSDWAQLLEQASDFNDELHRENCELHREVSVLRQRQRQRRASAAWSNSGNEKSSLVRKLRSANLVPRVMSQVQQALHSPGSHSLADAEGLSIAVEDAIRRVLAAADSSTSDTARASNDDTAALVTEKVALKEFSMRQQERLLELELAREKLSGSSHGHWATRLTSHLSALHGSLAEQQAAPPPPAPSANFTPEKPSPPSFCVGDECRIVGRKGAILRESENLDSKEVATLPPESRVRILELGAAGSRRARVQALAVAAPVGEADGQGACEGSPENPSQQPSETGAGLPAQDSSITALDESSAAPAGWLSVATKDFKALIRHVAAREPVDGTPAATAAQVKDCSSVAGAEAGLDGNSAGVDAPQLPSQPLEVVASCPSEPVVAPSNIDGQTTGTAEVQDPLQASHVSEAVVEGQPAPATTVTVSTEEWLALRNERNQRERQIKALQVQVETAQQELDQLTVVRTQLREQRNLALEARRRGTELYETALMAAEELASLRSEESELACPTLESGMIDGSDCHEAPRVPNAESGIVCGNAEAQLPQPEKSGEQLKVQAGIAGEESTAEKGEVQRQRSIEWQRLLSERETTATELGITLERIEQLEAILEDQRIELQITERRRERERRSLLTALRQLNSQDCTKSDGDLTEGEALDGSTSATESQPSMLQAPAASLLQAASSSASTSSSELQYLQKISRLEEVATRLRADLEKVQAREVALNDNAVTRGAALRYATSAFAEHGPDVAADVSIGPGGEESPSSTGRADLDGLMEMLDRLFVENFALRGGSRQQGRFAAPSGGRGGSSSATPTTAVASSASLVPRANSLDLSRFILHEDGASDDEDNAERSGPSKPPPVALAAASSRVQQKPKVLATTDAVHRCGEGLEGPKNSDAVVSPRSRLLRGLDFHAMPVAE